MPMPPGLLQIQVPTLRHVCETEGLHKEVYALLQNMMTTKPRV